MCYFFWNIHTMFILLECVHWKSKQVSDIYSFCKINAISTYEKKSLKGSMLLSFLVLLVSLLNFSGAFNSLVTD